MVKLVVLFVALLAINCVRAQTCLPDGINFTTQAQINSFQINYPNCTSIEGDVIINGADITNLSGLSMLTSIGGSLSIGYYENDCNPHLTSLSGLNGLTHIGSYLQIMENLALSNLSGLNSLTNIGGDFNIINNTLSTLAGLQNLNSIGGSLVIEGNYSLLSLEGLYNLSSIGNQIYITANNALTSLAGLNNINAASIYDLNIFNNNALSDCAVQSICNYLASPNGVIGIINNAVGCNTPPEIAADCGITLPCLPYGNYFFNSQAEIDNFQTNYPGCASLQGNVFIDGDDILNLNGFNVVTSFEYNLSIADNPVLANLSGLDSVVYIGNSLLIGGNPMLTSIAALANLNYVGAGFSIENNKVLPSVTGLESLETIGSDLYIGGNDKLTSLTGLASLDSIGQSLSIIGNKILPNLSGLENLEAGSIIGLNIYNNKLLTACNVQSVCDYLAAPNAGVLIYSNALGCNSPLEIIAACTVGSSYMEATGNGIALYPNPATDQITLESPVAGHVTILNLGGQKLIQKEIIGQTTNLDICILPKGVYFVHFVGERNVCVYKFCKQ